MRVVYLLLLEITMFGSINYGIEIVAKIFGGPVVAEMIAGETGCLFGGHVKGYEDTYIFNYDPNRYPIHHKRDPASFAAHDERVLWAEVQHERKRVKRDYLNLPDIIPERMERGDNILSMEEHMLETKSGEDRYNWDILSEHQNTNMFNDELWDKQWYLKDTRTRSKLPKLDLNVLRVYQAGITGRGVRISVLDDGLEYTHEDLIKNYDPTISYDCNEEDEDPTPRYDKAKTNSHGTRCAGEIAMMANNKKCGVGVAFNARIGGIKVLDGLVNDRLEGTALSFGIGLIDIYSASWGPSDDGETVDGPGILAQEALVRSTQVGRQGKGSIFVWASGNGGGKDDNCNCDGYSNSIFTISIGSANERGIFPWYGEACSSILAVAYSSGAYSDQMIVTTDLNNNCTVKHTGTSASAPLAAGILALALEVNPFLTWRDMQHLIVWTSEAFSLAYDPGWRKNGIGLLFNNKFGYGLLNAFKLVEAASKWISVPEKSICIIEFIRRGSLEIQLTSPSGTTVQLLAPRKLDLSGDGFFNWSFMSVMTWGEQPHGIWDLSVYDKVGPEDNVGYVGNTQLVLHGTKSMPSHMKGGIRVYNKNNN